MPLNAISVSTTDVDLGLRDIIRELEREEPPHVDVGVLAKEGGELVIIAAANEFGTKTIPSRSFIRSTIDDKQEQIMDFAESQARRIADGQITKKDALEAIGELIKSLIQLRIIELREPPNAPSTIRQKGSSNPLIGKTGRLNQSIAWRLGGGSV